MEGRVKLRHEGERDVCDTKMGENDTPTTKLPWKKTKSDGVVGPSEFNGSWDETADGENCPKHYKGRLMLKGFESCKKRGGGGLRLYRRERVLLSIFATLQDKTERRIGGTYSPVKKPMREKWGQGKFLISG